MRKKSVQNKEGIGLESKVGGEKEIPLKAPEGVKEKESGLQTASQEGKKPSTEEGERASEAELDKLRKKGNGDSKRKS